MGQRLVPTGGPGADEARADTGQGREPDSHPDHGGSKRPGRKRGIEADVERLREAFRTDWARQPGLVEDALGEQTLALLGQLTAACTAAADLAQAVDEAFPQHPDSECGVQVAPPPMWGGATCA